MGIAFSTPPKKLIVLPFGRDEDGVSLKYLRTAGGVDTGLSSYRLPRGGKIRALSAQFAAAGSMLVEIRKVGDPTPLATLPVASSDGGDLTGLNVPVQAGDAIQVYLCDPDLVDITKLLPVDGDTIAKYAFDEVAGSVFADSSPNGLGGSIIGNPALGSASRPGFGSAIEFPGSSSTTNDYAVVPDDPLFDIAVGTVECFFKLDTVSSQPCLISRDASGQSEPGHIAVYVSPDGSINCRLQNATQSITITSALGLIQAGIWHHVAAVFGGPSGLELYVDGILVASDAAITSGIDGNSEDWVFGARNSGSGTGSVTPLDANSHIDGLLDEVRVSSVRRKYVGAGVDRPVATVYVEQP